MLCDGYVFLIIVKLVVTVEDPLPILIPYTAIISKIECN